jgi:hypothetical protein
LFMTLSPSPFMVLFLFCWAPIIKWISNRSSFRGSFDLLWKTLPEFEMASAQVVDSNEYKSISNQRLFRFTPAFVRFLARPYGIHSLMLCDLIRLFSAFSDFMFMRLAWFRPRSSANQFMSPSTFFYRPIRSDRFVRKGWLLKMSRSTACDDDKSVRWGEV